jgi:hypothetical protein
VIGIGISAIPPVRGRRPNAEKVAKTGQNPGIYDSLTVLWYPEAMSDSENIGQPDQPEVEEDGNPAWSLKILQYGMLLTMLLGIGIAGLAGGDLGSISLTIGGGIIAAVSGAFYVFLTLRG